VSKLEQAARQVDKTAMRVEQDCEEALGEDGMVMVVPLDAYNDMMEAITALREALADPQITTPDVCGEVCVRAKLCYGCNKDIEEANASWMSHDELNAYWSGYGNGKRKALSESVAFKFPRETKPEQSMGWTIDYGLIRQIAEDIGDQEFIPSHEGIELVLLSLEGIYAAPVQQAEQEPVAWKHDCAALCANHVELWIDNCPHCGKPRPAPVQQVDLTDEEELELARSSVGKSRHWLVAAAIAAYKEKNK